MGKTITIIILLGLVAYLYFFPAKQTVRIPEVAKIQETKTETPKQKIVVEETIKEVYR